MNFTKKNRESFSNEDYDRLYNKDAKRSGSEASNNSRKSKPAMSKAKAYAREKSIELFTGGGDAAYEMHDTNSSFRAPYSSSRYEGD